MKRVCRRIAINAQLDPAGVGGVETNFRSMLEALGSNQTPELNYSLLSIPKHVAGMRSVAPHASVVSWPHGQSIAPDYAYVSGTEVRGFYEKAFRVVLDKVRRHTYSQGDVVDRELQALGVDIVHFPAPQFFITSLPVIYEPWDLQHLHWPTFFSSEELSLRTYGYRLGCQRASLVVTATQWVKDDIVNQYCIDPDKVVVVRRGSITGRQTLTESQVDNEIDAAGLIPGFMFYPAMCFEHKNHVRLLRALARMREAGVQVPKLVFSGRLYAPYWPTVKKTVEELGLQSCITVLGSVSDNLLTALYRRARLMVFPSLFEGLGLPLLEALHHELPVVASKATCIPEVIGDAGILFDGLNEENIASTLTWALSNPDQLHVLVKDGAQRLAEFSWSTGRDRLYDCYNRLLENGRAGH